MKENESLVRQISTAGIWLLAINGMIGAGIFGVPAGAAALAGIYSPLVFLGCGLLLAAVVLCFAELASYFRNTGGPILYALDYLAYAYLQRAEDDKAREVLNTLQSLEQPVQPHIASAYTLAAVLARFALERHGWQEAAALEAERPRDFRWDELPAMEAISHFAQALGSARSGNEQAPRQAIQALSRLHNQVPDESDYWAKQVEIQRLAADGWLAWAKDN